MTMPSIGAEAEEEEEAILRVIARCASRLTLNWLLFRLRLADLNKRGGQAVKRLMNIKQRVLLALQRIFLPLRARVLTPRRTCCCTAYARHMTTLPRCEKWEAPSGIVGPLIALQSAAIP